MRRGMDGPCMDVRREESMRIGYVVPHGWKFSGWSLADVMNRYHYSKHVASLVSELGHQVTLWISHEELTEPRILQSKPFRIEGFPVSFTLPVLKFGGDFSLPLIRRLRNLEVDVVHVHGCFDEALLPILLAAPAPPVLQWHGGRVLPFHRALGRAVCARAQKIVIPFDAVKGSLRAVAP